ncbi:NfeD family protein [Ruminococcaceae bacterium OttesenSCG-928-L11]|nr:NfeD family protein [Ruminococcaceae bacterium OttesenSCG-928-L11]
MTGSVGVFLWLIIAVGLFVVEGITVQLVSIWFAVGAIVAVLPAALGGPFWLQLAVFLLFSILFLFIIRPVVKDKLIKKRQPTNADMVIGKIGVVLEEIDNIREVGRVSANGLTWSARSETGEVIPGDASVLVKKIEGVKLIVVPYKNEGGTH